MEVLSTKEFAAKHGVTSSRIRRLIYEGRVYPYQKGGYGYIMFGNSVILAPHDRHGAQRRTWFWQNP